jgi:hypothetical protein
MPVSECTYNGKLVHLWTLGNGALSRHREARRDVAIQSLLITLTFWIASLRSQ